MKKFIVAIILFISCQLSAQTERLGDLFLRHSRIDEPHCAFIGGKKIPFSKRNWDSKGNQVVYFITGEVQLIEIYKPNCQECPANYIYYDDGGSNIRLWKLNTTTKLYDEVKDSETFILLMAG